MNGINEKRNKIPGKIAKKKLNAKLADLVPNVPLETASIKNLATQYTGTLSKPGKLFLFEKEKTQDTNFEFFILSK